MSQDPGRDSSEVIRSSATNAARSLLERHPMIVPIVCGCGNDARGRVGQEVRRVGTSNFSASWRSYQLELAESSGVRRTRGMQMPWDREAASRATTRWPATTVLHWSITHGTNWPSQRWTEWLVLRHDRGRSVGARRTSRHHAHRKTDRKNDQIQIKHSEGGADERGSMRALHRRRPLCRPVSEKSWRRRWLGCRPSTRAWSSAATSGATEKSKWWRRVCGGSTPDTSPRYITAPPSRRTDRCGGAAGRWWSSDSPAWRWRRKRMRDWRCWKWRASWTLMVSCSEGNSRRHSVHSPGWLPRSRRWHMTIGEVSCTRLT